MRAASSVAVLVWLGAIAASSAAFAQDDAALLRDGLYVRDRNISVTQRPKPEYDAAPIRLGAFVVSTKIGASVEYNDNIYADNGDKTSDTIVHVLPSIAIQSDWSRNQVSAYAKAVGSYYSKHDDENTTDYDVGAAGRLDADRSLGFAGGVDYQRDTEPRTSSSSPTLSAKPVRYDLADGFIEGTKEFNRLRLTAKGSIDDFTYDNTATSTGIEVYEKDRSHTVYTGGFQAEYAYLPDTGLLASLVTNSRDYRDALPGEILRNSSGYEATVGANFDLTHLARGQIYVGYLEQKYDSSQFKKVSGLALRGQVEYFLTQLTTVTLAGSRTVQDSGIFNVGGYLSNNVSLTLDHELLRNLVLSGAVNYGYDDYQNYDRSDKRFGFSAGADYLLNRAFSAQPDLRLPQSGFYGRKPGPELRHQSRSAFGGLPPLAHHLPRRLASSGWGRARSFHVTSSYTSRSAARRSPAV